MMKKEDFYFDLPAEQIAQYPLEKRSDSRLLRYQRGEGIYGHYQFKEIIDFLNPGDLLVLNDTKVIPARLFGQKLTGGRVELLVERIRSPFQFLAHIKTSKSLKKGAFVFLAADHQIEIIDREDDLFVCQSTCEVLELLDQIGHIPLPHYMGREEESLDKVRYQTVYARHQGSVAAPTAGLHFDEALLSCLRQKGIQIAYLTLHVGAGTFRPVRCELIQDHKMHAEYYILNQELVSAVAQAKAAGRRVIAVGTTALRSLESGMKEGVLKPYQGETNIFIYPGYEFKICDGLITNFHLPESTLLMLVSAFIGHQETMALYQEAIKEGYRFFSYGDACLFL